jgi:anti-sigma regulatory factor (Ser/Thr protein kinase)
MKVDFHSDVAPEFELDETEASHLYRIAQEALTNTARHGRASRVDMVLQASAHLFTLHIADDGGGFTLPVTSSGMGLKIMKYRAGMIGAKFKVGPNEPRGTLITVTSERPVTPKLHSGPTNSGPTTLGSTTSGSTTSGSTTPGEYDDGSQQRMGSISGSSGPPLGGQYR